MQRALVLAAIAATLSLPSTIVAAPAQSSPLRIVPLATATDDIARSRSVTIIAYTLRANSSVGRALAAAARRGADAVLVLDSTPYPANLIQENINTGNALGAYGVHVIGTREDSHLKMILVDGKRLYLSDRNFPDSGGLVLESNDPEDYDAASRALYGQHDPSPHLRTVKSQALAVEAAVIRDGSGPLDFSSESFGSNTAVFDYLLMRAQRGDRVRIIVNGDEAKEERTGMAALLRLRRAGAIVRVSSGPSATNDKLAVDRESCYFGSANATGGLTGKNGQPDQADWGYSTTDPAFMGTVRELFERDFAAARDL